MIKIDYKTMEPEEVTAALQANWEEEHGDKTPGEVEAEEKKKKKKPSKKEKPEKEEVAKEEK